MNNSFKLIFPAVVAAVSTVCCSAPLCREYISPDKPEHTDYNYQIDVDAADTCGTIPNIVSNINVWDMGTLFVNPSVRSESNIFDFVEYVQLMTATGGNPDRDLFKNPTDRTVLDDYDFDRLIQNCRGILSLGAKPHIKFGNVPVKLSKGFDVSSFNVNVYPPEDYKQYYTYIRAIVQALCDEFGKDELLSWHYGVYTEYENKHWFQGCDCTGESAFEEYCKIYDWTVQALIDVIGRDGLYVGAHSMTNIEGLWDERLFIRHCADGKNWANGGTGSYITYLSASAYDAGPGGHSGNLDACGCIALLKDAAENYGLKDLVYGIDEGRIYGASKGLENFELRSRTVGFTFMAAYDARLYTHFLDAGGSYFSSWEYLSRGISEGNPSMSFHVAANIAKMKGLSRCAVSVKDIEPAGEAETGGLAGTDPRTGRTLIMLYNYFNSAEYADTVSVRLTVKTSLKPGIHSVVFNKIGDDCNWFDEWTADRKEMGITDDMFKWSPDDACSVSGNMVDRNAKAKYEELEAAKYAVCSRLVPQEGKLRISDDGMVSLCCPLGGNNVWFIEIM